VCRHTLVDPDHPDAVEPTWVIDQDALALGQDRVVGGVPRHPETFGDAGHGQVLTHDPFQCPAQAATRQLRPRLGRLAGVLAPHVPTARAPVATDCDQQRRGPPAKRLVRQATHHRVPRSALAPAAATPHIRLHDAARQDRTVRFEPLPHDFKSKLVEASERGQVRASEGSVRHVEVVQMGGVRTSIIGRPRRLPRDRRADPRYTVNFEEPVNAVGSRGTGFE